MRSSVGNVASDRPNEAKDDLRAVCRYSCRAFIRRVGWKLSFVVLAGVGERRYSVSNADVVLDLVSSVCAYVDAAIVSKTLSAGFGGLVT